MGRHPISTVQVIVTSTSMSFFPCIQSAVAAAYLGRRLVFERRLCRADGAVQRPPSSALRHPKCEPERVNIIIETRRV